jgi:hypothetical protein
VAITSSSQHHQAQRHLDGGKAQAQHAGAGELIHVEGDKARQQKNGHHQKIVRVRIAVSRKM